MTRSDDSDGLEAVNVRLPDELLKTIDSLIQKGVFANRSEAIREFCREYALESRKAQPHRDAQDAGPRDSGLRDSGMRESSMRGDGYD